MNIAPQVLSDYFAAANNGRIADAADCFAAGALVHDESHDHIGRDAIRAWIADTTYKYQPRADVIRVETAGGSVVATASVSGDFSGSPAQLEYTFAVRDGKITQLTIQ